jgi:hypothetical protein
MTIYDEAKKQQVRIKHLGSREKCYECGAKPGRLVHIWDTEFYCVETYCCIEHFKRLLFRRKLANERIGWQEL